MLDLALELDAATESTRVVPDQPAELALAWVAGESYVEIHQNGLAGEGAEVAGVAALVEHLCSYGLAWAVSGLLMFARETEDEGDAELPVAAEYWPSMLKYGLPQPNAAGFAIRTGADRQTCLVLASECPNPSSDVVGSNLWLASLSVSDLVGLGVDGVNARRIASLMRDDLIDWDTWGPEIHTLRLPISEERIASVPATGDHVLLRPMPGRRGESYRAYSADGTLLGRYLRRARQPDVFWLSRPDLALATVSAVELRDDGTALLTVQTRRLAE